MWEAWRDKTGLKILDGIGSTEMLHIFVGSPEPEIRPGATGRAVPGYVAEVHDDDGRPVPEGTVGRLAVKGPTGCKYLDDERQQNYVQNGWNYPGDAYRADADGYFWYVARTDDMIVSAGYNISGPEVEQALIAHADVKEVAVVGKAHAEKQTQICQGVRRARRRRRGPARRRFASCRRTHRAVQDAARDRVRRRTAAHRNRQTAALQVEATSVMYDAGTSSARILSCGH